MRNIRHWIVPIATVMLLLASSPSGAANQFEQNDPTPTPANDAEQNDRPLPEGGDGELWEGDMPPLGRVLDTCVDIDQIIVCYVDRDNEFWVKDNAKDGYSAVGLWYLDVEGDNENVDLDLVNTPDPADRFGTCRNPHGYDTWAVCYVVFDPEEDRPLHFVAHTADLDGSEGGNLRFSTWVETES